MSKEDEIRMKEALAEIVRLCVEAREDEQVGSSDGKLYHDEIEEIALGALFK